MSITKRVYFHFPFSKLKRKKEEYVPLFLSTLKIKLKLDITIKKLIITKQNELQRRNHR